MEDSLKTKALYLFLFDHEFYLETYSYFDHSLFDNIVLKYCVVLAKKFYDKYGNTPNATLTMDILSDILYRESKLSKYHDRIKIIIGIFSYLEITASERTYLIDRVKDFFREKRAQTVIRKAPEYLKEGDIDGFVKEVNLQLNNTSSSDGSVLKMFNNIPLVISSIIDREEDKVATLIPKLDLYTHGGLAKKELGVVMAGPGVGKSSFLLNLAWSAMLQKRNVLYFTLEVSKLIIYMRCLCLATGLTVDEIIGDFGKEAMESIGDVSIKSYLGKMKIIEYPPNTIDTLMIDNQIEYLLMEGDMRSIDLVIVDYGDLLIPANRYKDRHSEMEGIYVDLRRIASQRDLIMFTASQVNREGMKAGSSDAVYVSGSWGKIATADLVLSLTQNEQDRLRERMRINILKNRNFTLGEPIEVETKFDNMSITVPRDEITNFKWVL